MTCDGGDVEVKRHKLSDAAVPLLKQLTGTENVGINTEWCEQEQCSVCVITKGNARKSQLPAPTPPAHGKRVLRNCRTCSCVTTYSRTLGLPCCAATQ